MKTKILLIALGFSIGAATWAGQPPQVEYSADSMMESAEVSMKGHVHYTPTRERREMVQGGQKMITIQRRDKKAMWTLMPEEKMYMEMNLDAKRAPDDLSGYKNKMTVVGPETVNGVSTNRSKVIMTDARGAKMGGFMWTTKDGIVVKIDVIAMDEGGKQRMKMELTNLKVTKQDPALFEIPAGYTKMDMGGLMGFGKMDWHK
jgi:hypothetical protein